MVSRLFRGFQVRGKVPVYTANNRSFEHIKWTHSEIQWIASFVIEPISNFSRSRCYMIVSLSLRPCLRTFIRKHGNKCTTTVRNCLQIFILKTFKYQPSTNRPFIREHVEMNANICWKNIQKNTVFYVSFRMENIRVCTYIFKRIYSTKIPKWLNVILMKYQNSKHHDLNFDLSFNKLTAGKKQLYCRGWRCSLNM